MPKIVNARNPKYINADSSAIDLEIKLDGSEEWLPFTATYDDPEVYGQTLYRKAKREEFGVVKPFEN